MLDDVHKRLRTQNSPLILYSKVLLRWKGKAQFISCADCYAGKATTVQLLLHVASLVSHCCAIKATIRSTCDSMTLLTAAPTA